MAAFSTNSFPARSSNILRVSFVPPPGISSLAVSVACSIQSFGTLNRVLGERSGHADFHVGVCLHNSMSAVSWTSQL